MQEVERTRILCVDDEPNMLDALIRALRRRFDVTVATGGEQGLRSLESGGPFGIVVSDLRMQGMDGVAFLSEVRQISPDSVRVLLTGQADLDSAIKAVNEGSIFRFLTKPVTGEALLQALSAAEAQYNLITAERVLLERTLLGSIQALTDVLAVVSPAAFGRAARLKQLVAELDARVRLKTRWQIEVAAMLSQIGSTALPPDTVERFYRGEELTHAERLAVERLPRMAAEIVGNIPRLEEVQAILVHYDRRFDGAGASGHGPLGKDIPLGARILKIVADLDALETQGTPRRLALDILRSREGAYDPDLLEAFVAAFGAAQQDRAMEIEIRALRPGMIFAEDVRTPAGTLLIARGQEVSARLVERFRYLMELAPKRRTVRVIVPGDAVAVEDGIVTGSGESTV